MDYFKLRRAKKNTAIAEHAKDQGEEPVLTEDYEAFLHKVITVGEDPPPLPTRHAVQDLPEAGSAKNNNAQVALMDGAQNIALPETPDEKPKDIAEETAERSGSAERSKSKDKDKKASRLSGFFRSVSVRRNQKSTAADLHSAAESLKSPTTADKPTSPGQEESAELKEAKKEEDEMALVLDQLNLAAVNNRAFSISDESKELMKKFTLVLKDLVNGVPTAYHDLESLLTNSEDQLNKMYKSMPGFLQSLIEKLPSTISEKFTESMGPELLSAAAGKAGLEAAAEGSGLKVKIPSLKELVTKQGAVASLLRAIMNFLRQRFPAVLGLNVLWSLALFVLLLIFWYCHKRGREVRLEAERKLTEEEMAAIKAQVEADDPGTYSPPATSPPAPTFAPSPTNPSSNPTLGHPDNGQSQAHGQSLLAPAPENPSAAPSAVPRQVELTTTAAPGASLDEVRRGMREVAEARAEAARNRGTYAEGGSLARAVREGEVEPDGRAAEEEEKGKGKGKAKQK